MELNNLDVIGKNIKQNRKKMNMTQVELGHAINKSESSIRKYEKGIIQIPLDVLYKIADILDTSIFDLIGSSNFEYNGMTFTEDTNNKSFSLDADNDFFDNTNIKDWLADLLMLFGIDRFVQFATDELDANIDLDKLIFDSIKDLTIENKLSVLKHIRQLKKSNKYNDTKN